MGYVTGIAIGIVAGIWMLGTGWIITIVVGIFLFVFAMDQESDDFDELSSGLFVSYLGTVVLGGFGLLVYRWLAS